MDLFYIRRARNDAFDALDEARSARSASEANARRIEWLERQARDIVAQNRSLQRALTASQHDNALLLKRLTRLEDAVMSSAARPVGKTEITKRKREEIETAEVAVVPSKTNERRRSTRVEEI